MKKKLLLLLAATWAWAIPACAWQEKAQDFGVITFEEDTTLPTETPLGKDEEPVIRTVTLTGVIETPETIAYMYGTHAIIDEASGARYALRSDYEALLNAYTNQRASIFGTPVLGYENGPSRAVLPFSALPR